MESSQTNSKRLKKLQIRKYRKFSKNKNLFVFVDVPNEFLKIDKRCIFVYEVVEMFDIVVMCICESTTYPIFCFP